MVGSQKSDLLEEDLILFRQKVDSFFVVVDLVRAVGGTYSAFLEQIDMVTCFLTQPQVLSLFYFELVRKRVVLLYESLLVLLSVAKARSQTLYLIILDFIVPIVLL